MGPRLKSRGKGAHPRGVPRGRAGFNGAAAEEPRKDRRGRGLEHGDGASMGPRLKSRGKASAGATFSTGAELQWGRG